MLEKVLKFQVVTKEEKLNSLQPLLPSIHFNIFDKQNNYTETIDHQFIGNRYCGRYSSQKRNQIKSIRRSKGVGYSQMIDNYKNASRQSQENPFSEELLIKQYKNNRNKEQYTERQDQYTIMMDYQCYNQEYKIQVIAQKGREY